MVIGDRVIQDRLSVVILRMTDLDTLQIARLAVLVGRIIRDIDLFTVIMPVVPFILESDALVSRDTVNKRRDLRIAVELHPLRKQRVIIGIIRIVLTGVVFCNDGIRCQIQEETGTPISDFLGFRKLYLQKVFQEVGVGIHCLSRSIQAPTNRCILQNGIVPFQTVLAVVSVVNIGYSADRFPRDSMPGIRIFDFVIEIHGA